MKNHNEITIIGGGIVGMTLSCLLADKNIPVTLIEKNNPKDFNDKKFDGRVIALSYDSKKLFEQLNIWDEIATAKINGKKITSAMKAGEILDIRIVDDANPLFLHFDHRAVGDDPMGHIVEIRVIRMALQNAVKKRKNISYLTQTEISNIEYFNNKVTFKCNDKVISTDLLIGADGRKSAVRDSAFIETHDVDYQQTAIVCTIKHEKKHQGVAIENFMPSGPFAILPMGDQNYSSLVWSEKSHLVPLFMKMDEDEFIEHTKRRFGDFLGEISLHGQRWSYPLALKSAKKYIHKHMCLVGDAAHSIHPISGQGFNLGLRDINLLAQLIDEQKSVGLDIGSDIMLEKYQVIRKQNNYLMIAATDGLNRLFSNNITPIRSVRRLGLALVEKQPLLKKFFIKHAMGKK